MKLNQLHLSLQGLCVYQALGEEDIFQEIRGFVAELTILDQENPAWAVTELLGRYGRIFSRLREEGYQGMGEYLWDYLRFAPTLYGKLVAEGRSDPALEHGARREVELLVSLARTDCDTFLELIQPHIPQEDQSILGYLPRWSSHCPFDFDLLTAFHQECGFGVFAKYRHFSWYEGQLQPLKQVEARAYDKMLGYELQREQVRRNTEALVTGQGGQNVLLFGDGGTGKSAVVKSMMWEFPRLRMVQVDHASIRSLPRLMEELRDSVYPFVVFLDDLAFDCDDTTFSALKSALEGGLEVPPGNVVVYATSNRRHLVRQTFQERAGEEVDMMETIAEKTALAQRFALRIPYMSMRKEEYLQLVEYLCQEKGKPIPQKDDLHHQAMMWEIRHGGRTPRVAEQFVKQL